MESTAESFIGSDQWENWVEGTCGRMSYINLKDIEFPKEIFFCDSYLSKRIEDNEILVLRRLGSPSADGEVYQIKYNEDYFAIKIMPHVDAETSDKNLREIEIASKVSNLVKSGK